MFLIRSALIAFLITRPCFANPWGGFYVGFVGGYESGNAKICPETQKKPIPANLFVGSFSGDFGYKGSKGDIIVGYGTTTGNHYSALEVANIIYASRGKITHTSIDHTMGNTDVLTLKVLRNESFNVSMRQGYKINEDSLLYIKPGISSTKFNMTLINSSDVIPDINYVKSLSKRFNGFSFEIGIETKLNERILVRVAGSHTAYRRKYFDIKPSYGGKLKFSPQAAQIKVGVIIPLHI